MSHQCNMYLCTFYKLVDWDIYKFLLQISKKSVNGYFCQFLNLSFFISQKLLMSTFVAFSRGYVIPTQLVGLPYLYIGQTTTVRIINKAIRFIECISMKHIIQVSPSLPYAGSLPPNYVGTLSALGFVSTMITINVSLSIYHIWDNRNDVRSAPALRRTGCSIC